MKSGNKYKALLFGVMTMICVSSLMLFGCGGGTASAAETIILRVSSWEEYIDEGEWDLEDAIELSDGSIICPQNSMLDDFEKWFYETYNRKVKVEYSTFGTNEELYNQMSMGDVYDLVCPSEYMIMKLMAEDMLVPFSEKFYDTDIEENYYAKSVSPYIRNVFDKLAIGGKMLGQYAAGYMWGTLGIVYNPDIITAEEAAHWNLLLVDKYSKQITIKDSVRDAYFAGNSIYNETLINSDEFVNSDTYKEKLNEILNATDKETIDAVEDILSKIKNNVYSFETDSGKADMVTGKVVANQQWSGDAVYTLDQAEEDGVILCYSAPEEATNLWFDGWCMLKAGVGSNEDKRLAAEAFVNFVSRPDNAVRNMCYIGYTSVISGGDDSTIFDYINYNFAQDEEEAISEGIETVEYLVGYFFTGDFIDAQTDADKKKYTIIAPEEQTRRQLFAQYPTEDVMKRSIVMEYFDKSENELINQMWLNVRCFDLYKFFGH